MVEFRWQWKISKIPTGISFRKSRWLQLCPHLRSRYISTYSSMAKRRVWTFINFEIKIPPAQPYFGLHVYCFWEKKSPCTLIFLHLHWYLPCTFINLEKKIPPAWPYLGLHVYCLLRIFPPACLFHPKRLFGKLEYRMDLFYSIVQLNKYETAPNFILLNQNLTWDLAEFTCF